MDDCCGQAGLMTEGREGRIWFQILDSMASDIIAMANCFIFKVILKKMVVNPLTRN